MRARDCHRALNAKHCRNSMRTKRSKLARNVRNGIIKIRHDEQRSGAEFLLADSSRISHLAIRKLVAESLGDSRVRARNARKQCGSLCSFPSSSLFFFSSIFRLAKKHR